MTPVQPQRLTIGHKDEPSTRTLDACDAAHGPRYTATDHGIRPENPDVRVEHVNVWAENHFLLG